MMVSKRNFLFWALLFRFHVKFGGVYTPKFLAKIFVVFFGAKKHFKTWIFCLKFNYSPWEFKTSKLLPGKKFQRYPPEGSLT